MGVTVDELVSRLRFTGDHKPLQRGERGLKRVERQAKGTSKTLKGLRRVTLEAFAAFTIGSAVKSTLGFLISTNKEFEVMKAQLNTVTGSVTEAERAFVGITRFAAETPFTVDQITEAFIRLKSLGLEPSEKALRSYGNTASAMGKPLMQFVEAIADAVTGEFERLKEFGIKARIEGEKVALTFQGQTTRVAKNAAAIEEFLRGLGEQQFAGAMGKQMATLAGGLSNLEDNAAQLALKIGERGMTTALKEAIGEINEMMGSSDALAEVLGDVLGEAALALTDVLRSLLDEASELEPGDIAKGIKDVVEVTKDLVSIAKFAVDAVSAMNEVVGGPRGAVAVYGALKTVTIATTLAQQGAASASVLMGVAMKGAAAGVGILGAALGGIGIILARTRSEIDELRESANEMFKVTERFKGSVGELKGQATHELIEVLDRQIAQEERRVESKRKNRSTFDKIAGIDVDDSALQNLRKKRRIAAARLAEIDEAHEKRIRERDDRVAEGRRRMGLKQQLRALEGKKKKDKTDIARINELRSQLGKDPIEAKKKGRGRKKKEVDDRSAFSKKVDARVDELVAQRELDAAMRAGQWVSVGQREAAAKRAGEELRNQLMRDVHAGNLHALGGEFSKENQMLRDAGILDDGARAAPPVLTVTINKTDVRVDAPINVKVGSARASAGEIGSVVRKEVRAVFDGDVARAFENVLPRQRR